MPESSSPAADWFTALVAEVCAGVTATADVQASLSGIEGETAESITNEIVGSADMIGDLRAEFSDLAGYQRFDALKTWERARAAVTDAEARLERALAGLAVPSGPPGLLGLFLRLFSALKPSRRGTAPAAERLEAGLKAAEARAAAERARQIYSTAAERLAGRMTHGDDARRDVSVLDDPNQLAEWEDVLRAGLREQLAGPVSLLVNRTVDGKREESYLRQFSYVGSARLAELLDDGALLGGEVNRAAVRAVQGMIDSDFTGAVGVAGPRGIGKTTLLTRFTRRSAGVCVAAPAQYDARDFLLHLFGQLCVSVLGEDEARKLEDTITGAPPGGERARFPYRWLAACAGATALLCAAVVAGLAAARPAPSSGAMTDLLIAGCCAAVAVMIAVLPDAPLQSWLVRWVGRRYQTDVDPEHRVTAYGEYLSDPDAIALYRRFLLWRRASVPFGALAVALIALVAAGGAVAPGYLAAVGLAVVAGGLYATITTMRSGDRAAYGDGPRFPDDASGPELSPGYELWEKYRLSPARYWYRRVKFQQSYTSGWSGSVTLAPSMLPGQAQVGWSGSTDTTPTAMSIPEIVTAFRSFAAGLRVPQRNLGRAETDRDPSARPTPVVIGIDEVDKIEDPLAAQAFFNQIKGLFGDTPCLFLISISDDAMAAYERRGLPLRDAFDSSLSQVVSLSYLSRQEARELISGRMVGTTHPSADLLHVLAGGLPRELVRLIRRAVELQRAYTERTSQAGLMPVAVPLDAFAVALIAEQVAAQQRAVLIRGRSLESCAATGKLLTWASDQADDAEKAEDLGRDQDAAAYLARLLHVGTDLLRSCDRTIPGVPELGTPPFQPHTTDCAARETGAFLAWLATVGQVFGQCETREDFEAGERPNGSYSFEWLARARQNFALGPDYVTTALAKVRKAWGLPEITRF